MSVKLSDENRARLWWLGSDSEPHVVYPKVILAITEKAQIEDVDLNAYKGYYEQK